MKSIQLDNVTYQRLLELKIDLSKKQHRVVDFTETVKVLLDQEYGGGESGDSQ